MKGLTAKVIGDPADPSEGIKVARRVQDVAEDTTELTDGKGCA